MRSKKEWRQRARENRVGLRIDHQRICAGLERFLTRAERRPGWVVGYDALPGEPDVTALFDRDVGGPFALTRTEHDAAQRELTVHPASSTRERHCFGFSQPIAGAPIVADDEIAVVLVPGLAFDLAGRRLGHGAGYYDRFLSRLGPNVWRVGVSDGFLVAALPTEEHDVAMTHLATEVGVWPVAEGA